ncbi:MAG TPA: tetratricopeptide repeat protein [Terracidiphilus sp.]|nr:tetratricopeptide repeat protein [Terracidiphilus sp.]
MLVAALVAAPAFADRDSLADADAALQAGRTDAAMEILAGLPAEQANSALAHNLRCRVLFVLEQWDGAANECQQAVNQDGNDSMYHLWLGRALGEKADNAPFWQAYGLAKRARVEFERSVELDSRNAEALADLGEFYEEAPGVVGGGTGKAQVVAAKLDRVDPARAHELRGGIAQENRDFPTAERELRAAVAASPHPAFQWMRLASFYRKQKRWNDMESAVRAGYAAAERDRHAGVALFNGASVLIGAHRDSPLAAKMLRDYLASPTQTEEGPTFVAHVWLARLEKQMGDAAGADREREAALAEASTYKPALELNLISDSHT